MFFKTHPVRCAAALLLLACPALARKAPAPAAPPPPPPRKAVSSGVYRDAAGKSYAWRITQTHILQWGGQPYLPVGGSFTPHSWVEGQTDDAWNADVQALQTLRQHGVTDLTLNAGALGLTHVPTDAVQRLLAYLDANGFRYGIQVADFPQEPLVGYTVEPSVFRNPSPPEPGQVAFTHIAGLKDAFAVLVSSSGERLETDAATIAPGGAADVTVSQSGPDDTPGSGDVLLLYPRRAFGPGTPESHLPDLWQGYDEYRDRLLTFFSHVSLGKGFRFFLDPLTDRIGMNGEVQNLVPTSAGFQRDFQAWLDQKYAQNLDRLNRQWGVSNRDLPGFDVAARCVPLWYGVKGMADLYDPATGHFYDVNNRPRIQSEYWNDLQEFKIESTRGYMDEIADALKRGVADVPVVYTWTQHSPLFTDAAAEGGYDGLGMEAYGHDQALTKSVGAYVYAQAEETPKTTWLIASATADAPPDQKTAPGFLSKAVLFDDWDALTRIGARGFYARALQALPAEANRNVNLAALPAQLDWLRAYGAMLAASAPALDSSLPPVLWYPQSVAGPVLGVRLLPDGVWWLPTFHPGAALTLGPSLFGYQLTDPDDAQALNVLWSPGGVVSSARFDLGKQGAPVITSAAGTPLPAPHKGGLWTIPVGDSPTVVRGVTSLPLSLDAPDLAQQEAERLLVLAVGQKADLATETGTIPQDLFRVENDTHDDTQDAGDRYLGFERIINTLVSRLQPYTWIEGESSSDDTFTSVASNLDASGGAYLSLNTDRDPPAGDSSAGYHATYAFRVNAPGDYTFWMGGSPPGDESSPFTWQVDDGAASPASSPATAGGTYASQFTWSDLGDQTLSRGKHTLTILVTGRRALDQRYALDLDAFCVTRTPFQPDGAAQPPLDSWLPAAPPARPGQGQARPVGRAGEGPPPAPPETSPGPASWPTLSTGFLSTGLPEASFRKERVYMQTLAPPPLSASGREASLLAGGVLMPEKGSYAGTHPGRKNPPRSQATDPPGAGG